VQTCIYIYIYIKFKRQERDVLPIRLSVSGEADERYFRWMCSRLVGFTLSSICLPVRHRQNKSPSIDPTRDIQVWLRFFIFFPRGVGHVVSVHFNHTHLCSRTGRNPPRRTTSSSTGASQSCPAGGRGVNGGEGGQRAQDWREVRGSE